MILPNESGDGGRLRSKRVIIKLRILDKSMEGGTMIYLNCSEQFPQGTRSRARKRD
jgi:hypothetical protein